MKQVLNWLWLGDYSDIDYALTKGIVVYYVGSEKVDKEGVFVCNLKDDDSNQKREIRGIVNDLVDENYTDNCQALVCCDAGVSRSPYIVARVISYLLSCNIDTAYIMLKAVYQMAYEGTLLRRND